MILAERGLYKETEGQGGGGGGATGRRNVFSATGENRNNPLISLRGALFNLGYGRRRDPRDVDRAQRAVHRTAAHGEMESTVLRPKPNFVRHPVSRHASVPEVARRPARGTRDVRR